MAYNKQHDNRGISEHDQTNLQRVADPEKRRPLGGSGGHSADGSAVAEDVVESNDVSGHVTHKNQ